MENVRATLARAGATADDPNIGEAHVMDASTTAVAVISLGIAKPGAAGRAHAALVAAAARRRQRSPRALVTSAPHRGRDDPARLMLYELWRDAAAATAGSGAESLDDALGDVLAAPLERVVCGSIGFVAGVPSGGTPGVSVLAYERAREGATDRLIASTAALFPPMREDVERVGIINVNVHRSASDPDQLVLYENWRRRADFVAFNGDAAPPYVRAYAEQARAGRPDGLVVVERMTEWTLLGEGEVRPVF